MAMVFTALPPLAAQERGTLLDIERRRREIEAESPAELFAINLFDSDVSLNLFGFWKGTLTGSWGLSKTKFGWSVATNETPVLFTQEADITLSLWIKERWFVEANFAEEYDLNTYRAGFKGRSGDFVRYAGIGNTGLDFPVFPYLDLGGDSSSSFGFYGAFGSGALTIHTLFRYDAAEQEERVFVGGAERVWTSLPVASIQRGVSFVLPDENISSPPLVYLEDKDGPFLGGGTRWRMARPSEAAVSARDGLVELSATPAGMVAVSYSGGYTLGDYGTSASPGGGFLGEAQEFFKGTGIDLKDYAQPGVRSGMITTDKPAIISIDGVNALVLYEKGAFSPFERQSRYIAPVSGAGGAELINSSTKEIMHGWDLYKLEDSTFSNLPLYVSEETETEIQKRDIYELLQKGTGGLRDEIARWPLGKNEAGSDWLLLLYLSGNEKDGGDVELRWTSFNNRNGYQLGSDVLAGSVQVFRGGIIDSNWNFDAQSGTVMLGTPAQYNELIRIRYLRRSLNRQNGSIAAGLGAVYKGEGIFSASAALGLRWNVSNEGYSESGGASPGVIGFGGKAEWNAGNIKTTFSLGTGFEQPDTTGLYRIAGMEGHENIFDLPDSSFISNPTVLNAPNNPLPIPPPVISFPVTLDSSQRAPLVYRNYRQTDFAGTSTLRPIDDDVSETPGVSGPYPARDRVFSARVMVAEFELDGATQTWAGFQSELPDGNALRQAEAIIIPARFYDGQNVSSLRVFVQMGALSGQNLLSTENPALIVEKELDLSRPQAQITLNATDRQKLNGATGIRILVLSTGVQTASGRLLVAPPVFLGTSFSPLLADASGILETEPMPVSAVETPDSASPQLSSAYEDIIKRLHPSGEKQRVLKVDWSGLTPGKAAGAGARAGNAPLANYKKLSFFINAGAAALANAPNTYFDFFVAKGRASFLKPGEQALHARFNASDLLPFSDRWVKVELRYAGADSGVYVDGRHIQANLEYRSGALRRNGPAALDEGDWDNAWIMFFLGPDTSSSLLPDGSFCIDELILEEGDGDFYINSGLRFLWSSGSKILKIRDVSVLEGARLETAIEAQARGKPEEENKTVFAGAVQRGRAEVSVFGVKIDGNAAFQTSSGDFGSSFWWTAGHGLFRAFGPFSLGERFFVDPSGGAWNHSAKAELQGKYHAAFNAENALQNSKNTRNWRARAGMRQFNGELNLELNADWRWQEEMNVEEEVLFDYAALWGHSWHSLVPDAGKDALQRAMRGVFDASFIRSGRGAVSKIILTQEAQQKTGRNTSGLAANFSVPWKWRYFNNVFRIERRYESYIYGKTKDALEDFDVFAGALSNGSAVWTAPPFYTLFAPELYSKFEDALKQDNATGGVAGELFGVSFSFPNISGILSLVRPREAEFHINRNLLRRLDTMQDILGLGGVLRWQALNIFGAFGSKPLLKFYQNDEFQYGLSTAIAIPKDDELSWKTGVDSRMIFFGFRGAEFIFADEFNFLTKGWTLGFTLEWLNPVAKTFLGAIYQRFMRRFENSVFSPALSSLAAANAEKLRKIKLQSDFDKGEDNFRFSISAGMESIVRVSGRLELSTFINLGCSQDQKAELLQIIATAGLSLKAQY
jgi:hypothetical protein